MKVLSVTTLPIYLPYDVAPIPFGDVFLNVSATANASASIFTVPGYVPAANDAVAFSNPGGNLDSNINVGQQYYTVNVSGDTFQVAATKGGAAILGAGASNGIAVHLLSNQTDGTVQPFKTGFTVVVLNMTSGTLLLQGATDANQAAPGAGYNPASSPGSFSTLVSVPASSAKEVVLSKDWINANANGLVLIQN